MERLQKVIAHKSEYSRRKAEELIEKGKVTVDGKVITELGTKVSGDEEILVNGKPLVEEAKVYYLLNKPLRTISARTDDKGRDTVVSILDEPMKIYPVGRLDYNTTGLIILTNDGELANGLMHPRHQVEKTYIAKVRGNLTKRKIMSLEDGVMIEGKKTLPAKVEIQKYFADKKETIIKITITEGRNLQVRKMFEAIGGKVIRLQRTNYAFLDLENLPVGAYRELKVKEVKKLYGLIK